MEDINEEDKCNNCRYNKFGHTTLIPNIVISEWYCGYTNSDEFCCGRYFEEDE